MANTLLARRSATAGHQPTTAQLSYGELAVNYRDGRLYFKANNGTADYILDVIAAGGAAAPVQSVNGSTGAVTIDLPSLTGTQNASTVLAGPTSGTGVPSFRQLGVADITGAAALASPAFSGTPTGPTAAADNNTTQLATTAYVLGQASTTSPVMNGVAAIGSSTRWAKADHVHPSDTSRAPLASPAFTGTPTGPTAAVNTNSTQLATTAFVLGQAGTATPVTNGTAAVGVATKFAREDHVHPSDTSRAPLADPTFTGNVTLSSTAPLYFGSSSKYIAATTQDAASLSGNNVTFQSSWGIGFGVTITAGPAVPVPLVMYSHSFNVRDGSTVQYGNVWNWGFDNRHHAFRAYGISGQSTTNIQFGHQHLSAVAVNTGGTGGWAVNDKLIDTYLNVYRVTSVDGSGVITGLAIDRQVPQWSFTPPANPVALTLIQSASGTGSVDANLTWTQITTLRFWGGTTQIDTVDINAGAIDGTAIGASSASTGRFTTLTATGATSLTSATASTPSAGDNSTNVATTAYVYNAINGAATISTTGGTTTLTAAQYGAATLIVTGTLTSNATLVVPNSGQWVIVNRTSGAFTVTTKTAAGTGITTTQGASEFAIADGTNVTNAKTDYAGQTISGATITSSTGAFTTLTASTPAAGSNSTNVATTAYVYNAINGTATVSTTGGTTTLSAAQYGAATIIITGALTSNATIVVPNTGQWVIVNRTSGAFTLTTKTASGTGITTTQGYSEFAIADGTNVTNAKTDYAGASITGATINNTAIGATTASTGRFTTLTSTSTATLAALTVSGTTSLSAVTNLTFSSAGSVSGTTNNFLVAVNDALNAFRIQAPTMGGAQTDLPFNLVTTADTTASNTLTFADASAVKVGMRARGTGISDGSVTVTAVDTVANTVTLSTTVTNTTGTTVVFYFAVENAVFRGLVGNSMNLRIFDYRSMNGAGWNGVSRRLQFRVDSSDFGYVEFNSPNGAVVLGYGAVSTAPTHGLRMASNGAITLPSTLTVSGGTVTLNNGSTNLISFNTVGVNNPTFTTRSSGTKLALWTSVSSTQVDYAFGIATNTLWASVPQASSTYAFRWFGGTTQIASLDGSGTLTVSKVTGLSTPTAASDAATKSYVDSYTSFPRIKASPYSAVGDGATDDTTAVSGASSLPWVFMDPGSYKTTLASNVLSGTFFGPGYIIDGSNNQRAKFFSAWHAAPSSVTSNIYSVETCFNGDYSHQNFSIEHRVYGASTLGTPTTGYVMQPQTFAMSGYFYNESGHMQNQSTGDGQTGTGFAFINVEHRGQANACALQIYGQSYGSNPSATGYLAWPSLGMLAGQVTSGATGTYLNPVEIHCVDNGYDSAAINFVATQVRSNGTGSLGASWIAFLGQSQGSQPSDAGLFLQGNWKAGLDFSSCTFSNQAALVMGSNHRFYLNAQNSNSYPTGTTLGGAYLVDYSDTITLVNDTKQLGLSKTSLSANCPFSLGGNLTPGSDNTYSLGLNGSRWAAVWAANGTIQTSDASLKSNITPLPAALPLVQALDPVTYRWRVGGMELVEVEEEQDVEDVEEVEIETREIVTRDGKAVEVVSKTLAQRPIFEELPVVDEHGNPVMVNVGGKHGPERWVQKIHRGPRIVRKKVKVQKLIERPGRRTHWGFLASDVKTVMERAGIDFGGYVVGEDGVEGLRMDQLVPILWKAVQELSSRLHDDK